MVFLLAFSAAFPTVGYGSEESPLKRRGHKLQQYVSDVLQTGGKPGAARQGPAFGSPLPAPAGELSGAADPDSLLHLLPEAAPASHRGPGRQSRRQQSGASTSGSSSSSSGGSGRGAGGRRSSSSKLGRRASSPSGIASPRAASEPSTISIASPPETAAHTPEACSALRAAASAATPVSAARLPATPHPSFAASDDAAAGAGVAAATAARQPLPAAPSSASSAGSRSLGSLTPTTSFGDTQHLAGLGLGLERAGSSSAGTAGEPTVDLPFVLQRLRSSPRPTGQLVCWGWEQAARLSHRRRSMPAELFAALWAATEGCMGRCYPQDVLGMLEAWYTLLQTCPRHFRLRADALESLACYSAPPAVKRMTERQLAQLASLAAEVALHRSDSASLLSGQGPSARDLMQPLFALAAAEAAWRLCNEVRYVSVATLSTLDRAACAWRWRLVPYKDSRRLAALKASTSAALDLIQGHLPALVE